MLLTIAEYLAPAATMIAAMMTAANLGARVTGWGFAVFTIGAAGWVIDGLLTGQRSLVIANGFLLAVDLVGVWRWLGRQRGYEASAETAERASARADEPTLFPIGTLPGKPLHDAHGATLGEAVEAMASAGDGRIAYVVVSQGGVGGVGETLHALGWNEMEWRDAALVTPLSPEALSRRPALDRTCWPASAGAAGVG